MVKMWLLHEFLTGTCSKGRRIAAQFLPVWSSFAGLFLCPMVAAWLFVASVAQRSTEGMPFDINSALGMEKGGELEFKVQKVGLSGKFHWFLSFPDPAVHLPAWIATGSIALALLGVLLAILK